jgi:uncharacterized membrane protein YhaH (DUF805 family)
MEVYMEFDVNKAIAYFQDVITKHYTDFSGRVSRKDFWTYIAVAVVIMILAVVLQNIVGLGIAALLQLALLLPNAGMAARRIQDTGKPGSLVWILMIPVLVSSLVTFLLTMTFGVFGLILFFLPMMGLVNLIALAAGIYMIYLCVQPGTAGPNPYGPEPATAT